MVSMKVTRWIFAFSSLALFLVWPQRNHDAAPPRDVATWEYRELRPQEVGPGAYQQVDFYQVSSLGAQGWELVSVTPYVLRNDLHEPPQKNGESKLVTQNYFAYTFKRRRPEQR